MKKIVLKKENKTLDQKRMQAVMNKTVIKDIALVLYIRKNVLLVSSLHHDYAVDGRTVDDLKPEITTFYNCTKSGVDTLD
ncbi:hypothetical protein PR048_028629 [Dryococelus australis]|uniref:Uncharacterized protein n=1 Tax=Dryococelus australis TaxID=614101 RepID=A0ABQ9GDN1_9NEOP|nr:hypothetical protein PR048_028629 [Dryococelus australis]